MRTRIALFPSIIFMALVATHTFASIPKLITFQGRLTDDVGVPVIDGSYTIEFIIHTDSTAGVALWSETQSVVVIGGIFNVLLGRHETLADSVFAQGTDVFVSLQLDGSPGEMAPRTRLTSGAFCYRALHADTADVARSTAANGWVDDGTVVRLETGTDHVGIGTASPQSPLHVVGNGSRTVRIWNAAAAGGCAVSATAASGLGAATGVDAYSSSPDGYAIYAFNEGESGNSYAMFGETNSPDGIAIHGYATNNSERSTGIGVYGLSRGDYGGTGVYGEVTNYGTTYGVRGVSAHGTGVRGDNDDSGNSGSLGRPNEGVYGRGFNGDGHGVHGVAAGTDAADSGCGVYGESAAPSGGAGVRGKWEGKDGYGYGVVGEVIVGGVGGVGMYGTCVGSDSAGIGVFGEIGSPYGIGVYGFGDRTNGTTYGVYGKSNSMFGYGVYGENSSDYVDAAGVNGVCNSQDGGGYGVRGYGGHTGVYGKVTPTDHWWYSGTSGTAEGGTGTNHGIYGRANGEGANYGVWGETNSDNGAGVYGYVSDVNSDANGVQGVSNSQNSHGVFGENNSGYLSATGVYGQSDANDGSGYGVEGIGGHTGVYGHVSPSDKWWYSGVSGVAEGGSGTNHGIYGRASGGSVSYAGYFSGDVTVTGSVSKAGGSFKIDHPHDPENKYLSHSFVESPDMMNIYNGNVVLDENGTAVVMLPDWFDAINTDFRYQLTCIGGFAPVYVASEIVGNSFEIAGGQPGMKVSWQVTGIRIDPWANANRIQVEQDKTAAERGSYLHPELYNQPQDKRVDEWLKAAAEQALKQLRELKKE